MSLSISRSLCIPPILILCFSVSECACLLLFWSPRLSLVLPFLSPSTSRPPARGHQGPARRVDHGGAWPGAPIRHHLRERAAHAHAHGAGAAGARRAAALRRQPERGRTARALGLPQVPPSHGPPGLQGSLALRPAPQPPAAPGALRSAWQPGPEASGPESAKGW